MTKFVAKFEFGSNITAEQAQEWIATIRGQLPEGTLAEVKSAPLILNVRDLTDAHKGEKVKVYVDKSVGEVIGKLEAVFPAGRQGDQRTLVIDGRAYTVNYGNVQLSEW